MKPTTTKTLIATALVAVCAGLSVTAIAQNANGPAQPPAELLALHAAQRGANMDPARHAEMQERMQSHMAERHADHMNRLKVLLQITPAQEAAFKAFAARTEPTAPKAAVPGEDWSQLTTPLRLDKMQAQHDARHAEMARRIEATRSFYAQLTPAQQKSFDTLDPGFHRAGMKGERRHGSRGDHGGKGRHGMGAGMGCDSPMPEGPMGGPGARS